MNYDLNGTQGVSRRFSTGSETMETQEINIPHAIPVDFQAYDGLDSLGHADIMPQQIIPKPVYETYAHLPTLIRPVPEDTRSPEPYAKAERTVILNSFYRRLQELLRERAELSDEQSKAILKAIKSGKKISNLQLANLGLPLIAQAKKEIQEKAHLPGTWEPISLHAIDWTPLTPLSFQATTPVDKASSSSLEGLNPNAVNLARAELTLFNITDYFVALDEAMKKVAENFPPESSYQSGLIDYQKVITKAIRELKSALREMQLQDAGQSEGTQQAKYEALQERLRRIQENYDKEKEMQQKQKDSETLSTVLKWVGVGISALALIISVAVLIVSLGTAAPISMALATAGIAVGLAMTTYAVVDSVTGASQKLMEVINKALEKLCPDNLVLQKLFKILGLVVIALVLVAGIVLGGGGALGIVVSSAAAQAIKEAIKLLSIQLLIMAIITSNAIPELFGQIVQSLGVSKEDSKTWEVIFMILTMITAMTALAFGSKAVSIEGMTEGVKSAGRSIKAFAEKVIENLQKLIDELRKGAQEALQAIIKTIKKALDQLLQALKSLPGTISEGFNTTVQRVKEAINELLFLIKNPAQLKRVIIDQIVEAARKFEAAIEELLEMLANVGKKVFEVTVKAKDIVAHELQLAMQKVAELIAAFIAKLGEGLGHLKTAGSDTLKGFVSIGKGFASIGELIADAFKNLPKDASVFSKALLVSYKLSLPTQKILELSNQGIIIVDGIQRGLMGLEVAKIYKELGAIKESEELLQAIMQLLDKLMKSIQTGMEMHSEWMLSLQRAYASYYSGLSRNTTKIFQTLQG